MGGQDISTPRPRSFVSGTLREIVVVVLSILIAFSLDAWWENLSHRRDVEEMLDTVKAEMEENRSGLRARIEQQGRAERASQALIELLRSNLVSRDVMVPDSLLASLWATPSFDPAVGSLDAVLGSESFGHIADPALRQELSSWMRFVRDAAEDEGHALDLARREVLPTLGTEAPLDRVIRNAYPWVFGDSVEAAFRTGTTRVSPSPRLLNFAVLRASYAGAARAELERVLTHTDAILTLIEQEVR